MLKDVPYLLIFVLFLITGISACGGGSSSVTPEVVYGKPTSFASYSSLPGTLRGGAVQWGPISTSTKFDNYSVSTFKGVPGDPVFRNYTTPNGLPATFNHPTDITTDGANFYVTDYGNNLIRKIDSDGKVTTIIGLYHPSGITTDGTNLYVAETGNNRIQVINIASGLITETFGSTTGLAGSVDVKVVPPATIADITLARFNQPIGITTDGKNNLYVTDFNNATVRWIDLTTKAVSTLAGASGASGSADGIQGAARFHLPGRITTDGKDLYLTDFYNRTIRRIVLRTGEVTTVAGSPGLGTDKGTLNGIGTAARFYNPNGITTDGINLYVTDSYHNTIRKIAISTKEVTTIPLPTGSLHAPTGLTTDGVSLFVADTFTVIRDSKTNNETYTFSNSIIRIH
ncbi:MAG: hypothetical protein HGB35_01685 [Geobacteraceae bacterium]|nr:hypothetical protein [Geobacteraceae bacterium]